ncbi:MAG TPA: TonB-dependent receptor [Chitinophagales bacterium]|nr:TonB-dependent receptor [Chitinophagales bacterium]
MKQVCLAILLLLSFSAIAQKGDKGSVKGFVYDKGNGEGVAFAIVRVEGTDFGAATDEAGFFSIPNLAVGKYKLTINFVGYEPQSEEIEIKKGQTINLKLFVTSKSVELKDVEISAERQQRITESRVSVTTITPMEMKRLPTVGGEADIAQYLQVLPGVVSTGDQGGQVVIRGGTPIQTKFLLDGITIYNPFHSIGLFSIYETDIIKNVDVYTGGFPSQYGGRISAVVDVTTRDGNRKKVSGKVSASPFMAHALLEIPVIKLKEDRNTSASLILNTKISYLDRTAKTLYPYAGKAGLPYNFYDVYGKFSVSAGKGNKFSITGFNYLDNTNFDLARYKWNTFGIGANFLAVPKNSNLYFNTHVSYSQYKMQLDEKDLGLRTTSIGGFDIGMDFVYYIKNGELKYGLDVEGNSTKLNFTNQYGQNVGQNQNTTDLSAYVMLHKYVKKFVIEGGFRFQYYGNVGGISPEPRLSMKYNITDMVRIKLATGMYSQNFISTKSDRDVVNLFTGFLTGPEENAQDASGKTYDKISNFQRSVHGIFGLELDLPKNVTINIEPYYKYFWHLFNVNRFKDEISDPNFLIEKGDAYGLDILVKWQFKGLYLYGTYSLAWTHRNDGLQVYAPHFDRRHNVNLVGSYTFGKKRDWEISARWNLGSGFPFTKTQGFYESAPFDGGIGTDVTSTNGQLGILYDSKINGGRLPYYHRLDMGVKKIFNIKDLLKIEINLSVSNVYNRNNIFYFDRVSYQRVNQLPVLPSLAVSFAF